MLLFKKLIIAAVLLNASLSHTTLASEECGSKEGYFNSLSSTYVIPDYFPPETEAFTSIVSDSDYNRCADISFTYLGTSCRIHDRCYDARMNKAYCDNRLASDWIKSCEKTYYKLTFDHQICRISCIAFAKLASAAQTYNHGDFCPSCDAYAEASQ